MKFDTTQLPTATYDRLKRIEAAAEKLIGIKFSVSLAVVSGLSAEAERLREEYISAEFNLASALSPTPVRCINPRKVPK